ncbi:MAG: transglutaminase family protein [Actinomycetota bacterium]
MRFAVEHSTLVTYSEPAVLGPHTIRMRPRCDTTQSLESWDLRISPAPAGSFEYIDRDGNAVTRVWWVGRTGSLSIRSSFTVALHRSNPFDFVVFDEPARGLPPAYPEVEREALRAYLGPAHPAAAALARDVRGGGVTEAAPFLTALTALIRDRVTYEERASGAALPVERTLAQGRGACRDLAMVFVEACRAAGIAARFVSGYQEPQRDDGAGHEEPQHLHAWGEAYLPGAGWRGYDPSQGLAVADRHVAVAAAALPADASPTEGTFGPSSVTASLEAGIDVLPLPPAGGR